MSIAGVFLASIVVLLAVALAARVVHRARESRRRRALIASLGPPLASAAVAGLPRETPATLEGVLERSSSEVVSFHPYGTSFLDEANVYAHTERVAPEGPLVVELGGGLRARIEGPVQVLTGSSETEHKAPLARAAELGAAALASAATRSRVGQFRGVRGGDRVRVRGVVSPAPDEDVLHYRESRGRIVRVTPLESGEASSVRAVLLAATDPPAPFRRRHTPTDFIRGGAAAVLVLTALGAFLVQRSHDRVRASTDAGSTEPATCRAAVLQQLTRNGPPAAEACPDAYARGMAAFADGSFPAASEELARARAADPDLLPSLTEAEAHLFAHDFRQAAATVRAMLPRFYPGPETADKRTLGCIAEVLEARAAQAAGGRGPILHYDWMNTDYRRICSERPFAMLARELDADGHYFGAADMKAWQSHVYANAGFYDVVGAPFTAAVAPGQRLLARPVALEKSLVDRLLLAPPAPSDDRFADRELGKAGHFHMEGPAQEYVRLLGFAADVALFHAYAGSPGRNARYWPLLDRAAQKLESGETYYRVQWGENAYEKKVMEEERTFLSYVMSVAAAAALAAGDSERTERYAKLGEVYSGHVALAIARAPAEATEEDAHWPENMEALAAGSQGDGARVAAAFRAHRSTGRGVLGRVLPRIRTNRRALDVWFDDDFPDACLTCGASALHGHLADRREVARLLGRPVEKERLGERASRFTDALTDPEIAFELDELETFFAAKR